MHNTSSLPVVAATIHGIDVRISASQVGDSWVNFSVSDGEKGIEVGGYWIVAPGEEVPSNPSRQVSEWSVDAYIGVDNYDAISGRQDVFRFFGIEPDSYEAANKAADDIVADINRAARPIALAARDLIASADVD